MITFTFIVMLDNIFIRKMNIVNDEYDKAFILAKNELKVLYPAKYKILYLVPEGSFKEDDIKPLQPQTQKLQSLVSVYDRQKIPKSHLIVS